MNFTKSNEWLERAKTVVPCQTQTFSKGPKYFPVGASPLFLQRGGGSHVWDVDGNEYVDFILGLLPISLGYHYPTVDVAIIRQLRDGIIFSQPHPIEVELSEKLTDIIPCAEAIRFTKTGSEATQAAIRIARAYTGRDHIAFRGYNGWHEWYAVTTELPKGIPSVYKTFMHQFDYNNIESLEMIFRIYPDQIAAVIMEPVIVQKPALGFLEAVKEVTHRNGALLIFDEIVTGFRWSLGGAQELFGVTPDLSTFGKGMANGMPLNCVVGRGDIMQECERVFFSGTFGGECLSLAASMATIAEMEDKDTIGHCWRQGTKIMKALKSLDIEVLGYPCRPIFTLPKDSPVTRSIFVQEMIKRGVLMHCGLFFNL